MFDKLLEPYLTDACAICGEQGEHSADCIIPQLVKINEQYKRMAYAITETYLVGGYDRPEYCLHCNQRMRMYPREEINHAKNCIVLQAQEVYNG